MKRLKFAAIATLAALSLGGCTKITQQDIGLRVSLMGDNKGGIELVSPGRYFVWPNTEYVRFPTSIINVVWTASKTEGSPTDQSITMQTVNGLVLNTDIGLSFHIRPEKAIELYRRTHKGIDEITNVYLRNMVRDAFNDVVSKMTVEQVYGKGKVDMMVAVTKYVQDQVTPMGIVIDKISILHNIRFPASVEAAIQAKVQAVQKAETRKNELAQAVAQKNIEQTEAESYRQAEIIKAQGDAQAMEIKAKVLRENPELLKLQAIQKWNGVTPLYMSGNSPIPFINSVNK